MARRQFTSQSLVLIAIAVAINMIDRKSVV